MTPEDIRRSTPPTTTSPTWARSAAFPKSAPLDDVLARFDRMLMKDAPKGGPRPADSLDKLPPPAGDPEGAIRIYEYPHRNDQQPSPMALAWPANRKLDAAEQLLAELFFDNFAGDATTNLYKPSDRQPQTRKLDIGARSVGSSVGATGAATRSRSFSTDVRPAAMTDERPARDPQRDGRGDRARRRLRRRLARAQGVQRADRQPRRRARAAGAEVPRHAARLRRAQRRLGLDGPAAAAREARPATASRWCSSPSSRASASCSPPTRNFWRERLAEWKITGVAPYVVGARPSPALIAREQAEREPRLAEETERLKRALRLDRHAGGARALRRRADAELAAIEKATRCRRRRFVKSPPMTLDDDLRFETARLARACRWWPRASTA